MMQALQVVIALAALGSPLLVGLVMLFLAERRDGSLRPWVRRWFFD